MHYLVYIRYLWTTGCVMQHCGSSPTEVILGYENGWILIIQATEK
jgi:hypothetical protein